MRRKRGLIGDEDRMKGWTSSKTGHRQIGHKPLAGLYFKNCLGIPPMGKEATLSDNFMEQSMDPNVLTTDLVGCGEMGSPKTSNTTEVHPLLHSVRGA